MKQNITEEEYKNLSWSNKNNYVKEWACICNECKHKWHYLDSVEKEMTKQMSLNGLLQAGNCCNPCVGATTSNATTQLKKQLGELKQCPKCGSSNVKKNAKIFKKQ
jgi:bacterioferritin-associated ferredoxin